MSGMELTHEQYERIADSLPVQRGNVRHENLSFAECHPVRG